VPLLQSSCSPELTAVPRLNRCRIPAQTTKNNYRKSLKPTHHTIFFAACFTAQWCCCGQGAAIRCWPSVLPEGDEQRGRHAPAHGSTSGTAGYCTIAGQRRGQSGRHRQGECVFERATARGVQGCEGKCRARTSKAGQLVNAGAEVDATDRVGARVRGRGVCVWGGGVASKTVSGVWCAKLWNHCI
jgi:hypothetical protein